MENGTSVKVDSETYEIMKKVAEKNYMKINAVIKMAVRELIKQERYKLVENKRNGAK